MTKLVKDIKIVLSAMFSSRTVKRIPFFGADGLLTDDATLTFDSATGELSAPKFVGTTPVAVTASGLTMSTARLLGRSTAATGAIEEIQVGTGLTLVAGVLAASGGGGGGTKTLKQWTATEGQPPAANFATLDTRNSIAFLAFDDTTNESMVFVGIIPQGADFTTGITVRLVWMAKTAVTGNVIWTTAFEKSVGVDLDTDHFATGVDSAAAPANGTCGIVTTTSIDHSSAQINGLVAGDLFRIKVTRNAVAGGDTMVGDAQPIGLEIQQR